MNRWIKCEDQSWINLDHVKKLTVEKWPNDSYVIVAVFDFEEEGHDLASFVDIEDAYDRLDALAARIR